MNKLTLLFLIGISAAAITTIQHKRVHAQSVRNDLLKAEISETASAAATLERERDARVALLEQRQAESHARRQQLAANNATPPGDSAESDNRWRDDVQYVRLAKDYLTKISVNPFAWNADARELSAEAATLFGLNAQESMAVNAAIANLSESYLQLELGHARPATPANHKEQGKASSFKISALPIQSAQLKDAFVESLKSALGQTRTDLIMHYARHVFWKQFADFEPSQKWITMWERTGSLGAEEVKVYVSYHNGAYSFALPQDAQDPNALLARHLLERARAGY